MQKIGKVLNVANVFFNSKQITNIVYINKEQVGHSSKDC